MSSKPTYAQLKQRVSELEKAVFKCEMAEKALRQSEERFGSLIHKIQVAVVVHKADTSVITCNPKAQELLGLTEDQLLGKTAIDPDWKFLNSEGETLPPIDYPVKKVLATRQPLRDMTAGIIRPLNSDLAWVLVNADPVFNDKGFITRVIVTFTDITERRRAEEMLRESEARYRELYISNPNPMWVYDLETYNFLSVNEAAISHYGYSREEFLSMTIKDIRPKEDIPRLVQNVEAVGEGLDEAGIWCHIKKDGSQIDVEITSHVLIFDHRRAEMVLVHDVTERKRIENERMKLHLQTAQSQKMESIGRLAGGIAHDFNNMLGVIIGQSELAMHVLNPCSPVYANLKDIRKSAKRSAALTGQLLAFARKQAVNPKVLDLNRTIDSILQMLRRLIGEDIQLDWIPGEDLWPIKMDPAQIDQVLTNLCVNARDAIEEVGTISIRTQNISLNEADCRQKSMFTAGDYVMLAVSDDGCGLDKNAKNTIFEPFYTTKEVGKGTGLGLSTVYGIIKQNKGIINVRSEPGQGTIFELYLRRVKEAIADKEKPIANAFQEGTETVLIVEDESSVLAMSAAMLKKFGYNVLEASSPNQAIAIAQQFNNPIHLLLTDVVMPEMNGKELERQIREINPLIKVLYMSGYTADVVMPHGITENNIEFLQKPFSIHTLSEKVRKVLDQIC